ncbi:MAG: hypothetical protein QHH15_00330 [Candidatus Thermoplasmatota archaeon]|nr:hypothetical protein [Candidatus Thermoplasmatota archaeon]
MVNEEVNIDLTGHDLELAEELAWQRHNKNEGVHDKRITENMTSWKIDFLGLLGELAVATYFNLDVDKTHYPEGGDGGSDFSINGRRVDVKYTNRIDYPLLMFPKMSKFRADIAILTHQVVRNCRHKVGIVGWIDKKHFSKIKKHTDFGYGDTLYVYNSKLFNIEKLKL